MKSHSSGAPGLTDHDTLPQSLPCIMCMVALAIAGERPSAGGSGQLGSRGAADHAYREVGVQ